MREDSDEKDRKVPFTLGKDEALILFEMKADRTQAGTIPISDEAERLALCELVATLEKTLVEPFMPNYRAIVDTAKHRICGNRE